MHINHGINMLPTFIHITPCMLMCTLVHIVDVGPPCKILLLIELMIQILQIDVVGLGKELTPMDPKEYGYQRPHLFYLM